MNVEIKSTYLNIGLSLSYLCNLGAIRAVLSEFFHWCCRRGVLHLKRNENQRGLTMVK